MKLESITLMNLGIYIVSFFDHCDKPLRETIQNKEGLLWLSDLEVSAQSLLNSFVLGAETRQNSWQQMPGGWGSATLAGQIAERERGRL